MIMANYPIRITHSSHIPAINSKQAATQTNKPQPNKQRINNQLRQTTNPNFTFAANTEDNRLIVTNLIQGDYAMLVIWE